MLLADDNHHSSLNDELVSYPFLLETLVLTMFQVYKTRINAITNTRMFNAGAERFVRDWRTSHVSVVVHDSRMWENDAILG